MGKFQDRVLFLAPFSLLFNLSLGSMPLPLTLCPCFRSLQMLGIWDTNHRQTPSLKVHYRRGQTQR